MAEVPRVDCADLVRGEAEDIAEALYNRVPVLATPRAAQGLPSQIGVTVLETAEEWQRFLGGESVRQWARSKVPVAAESLREYLR